jgi:hypothetical protein
MSAYPTREERDVLSDSDRAVIKGQLAALGFVKLVASILTLYYFPSWHAIVVIAVLSTPWLAVGGYYLYRSGRFRYRYWKYRHLRRRLIREEWIFDGGTPEAISGDRRKRR